MLKIQVFVAAIFGVFLCNSTYAQEKSCRSVIYKTNGLEFRKNLYNYANKQSVIVCPFSDGKPVVILSERCNLGEISKVGPSNTTHVTPEELSREAFSCSPALSIIDSQNPNVPIKKTYIISLKDEPFSPGASSARGHRLDFSVRQFITSAGLPISYYNSTSNVLCFSSFQDINLIKLFKTFEFKLPISANVETSQESCPSFMKEKYNYELPYPANHGLR